MAESVESWVERVETLISEMDEHLAEHRSAKVANARNQLSYALPSLRKELGQSPGVIDRVVVAQVAGTPAEPKYDQHEWDRTSQLISLGVLPEGSTPAAFREWQRKRREEMAVTPSLADQLQAAKARDPRLGVEAPRRQPAGRGDG